ncbi:RNA polymerase sigma factor [Amphibacillus sediminis]|uniref:RNA polymerase sigma factor n=1 Tax=Amphibacillus sediminis TaxID=360185 RepID=UPI00082B2BCC|nr:RNA polymerase sigma factor [Amphibacillus sediminis]
MEKIPELQDLEREAWQLKKQFLKVIEPYRTELWRYCHYLTNSPWDAEDLAQETLMKAFASLGQIWQPLKPKNYLFRIATNTWINQYRKKKIEEIAWHDDMTDQAASIKFDVTESIETLVHNLPLRQVVVIILIDVFDFTAKETAELISSTEGAVKAALHRARYKLQSISKATPPIPDNPIKQATDTDSLVINAFVNAFNARNPNAMAALLDENAYHDIIHVGQELGKDIIQKYSITDEFKDPTIEQQHAEVRKLWGRTVVAILIKQNDELQLNDIIYLKTEQDRIVFFSHYYFCQDFLEEAANAFNIPVQKDKNYMM